MSNTVSRKRPKFTIAIDFDGCLCRSAWPDIGEEMPGAMEFLSWLADNDFDRVLWTCRTDTALNGALKWLGKRGFPAKWWTAINDNTAESIEIYGNNCRKLGCDVLVDDRAVGFPWLITDSGGLTPDWERIKDTILRQKKSNGDNNAN